METAGSAEVEGGRGGGGGEAVTNMDGAVAKRRREAEAEATWAAAEKESLLLQYCYNSHGQWKRGEAKQ